MRKEIKIIIFFITVIAFSSCTKDFFDANENQFLTNERKEELKKESPESVVKLVQGSLNGVYNNNVAYQERHDDFGLKAFHLAGDLTGIDMVQTKHHWFGFDYNVDNNKAPYRRTRTFWGVFYRQISSANIIIQDYFAEPVESEVLKRKEAETKALRGIAYYYLVNLYQQTYKGNENKAGVPLVLSPLDENMPREKVQKVYDQIIEDLTYAVENNVVTDDKKDADKAVAAAYLAKTYAAMEKWDKVAEYAKIASDAAPLTSASTVESGKWDIGSSSWLWGFDITGETTTLYASFYSHMDNTIKGYAGALQVYKSIYSNLYDKIGDTDVRKKLYINADLFPDVAKSYSQLPKYANIKFITSGDFTGDYCYIRTEDPYLLLIEANVELNNLTEARRLLSSFMALRDSNYDVEKFDTQSKLRDEVRLQRRIELWGEGTSFYDIKRWKLGIDRTVEGSNHRTKIKVPAGDKKWVYQIPQREMDSNPNIGDQNP